MPDIRRASLMAFQIVAAVSALYWGDIAITVLFMGLAIMYKDKW